MRLLLHSRKNFGLEWRYTEAAEGIQETMKPAVISTILRNYKSISMGFMKSTYITIQITIAFHVGSVVALTEQRNTRPIKLQATALRGVSKASRKPNVQ